MGKQGAIHKRRQRRGGCLPNGDFIYKVYYAKMKTKGSNSENILMTSFMAVPKDKWYTYDWL